MVDMAIYLDAEYRLILNGSSGLCVVDNFCELDASYSAAIFNSGKLLIPITRRGV